MRASSLGSLGLRQADEAPEPATQTAPQKPQAVAEARAFSWKEPAVLGAVDGLITSFVIVASGAAGALEKRGVVVVLASSLVADAFSMGVSEYLSSRLSLARRLALLEGLVCFLSFAVAGAVPLLAYALLPPPTDVGASGALFAVALLGVGLVRGASSPSAGWSALEVFALGVAASGLSVLVAWAVR